MSPIRVDQLLQETAAEGPCGPDMSAELAYSELETLAKGKPEQVMGDSVIPAQEGLASAPDWYLGALFGAGGFAGMYCGARLQKYVPQKFIKLLLGLMITFLAGRYILQYFR
jgi:hypothetical protein